MDLVELRKKKKAETEAASKPADDSSAVAETRDAEDAKSPSLGGDENGAETVPGEGSSSAGDPDALSAGLTFGEKGDREEGKIRPARVPGRRGGVRSSSGAPVGGHPAQRLDGRSAGPPLRSWNLFLARGDRSDLRSEAAAGSARDAVLKDGPDCRDEIGIGG